jgi:hypothetical protein
MESFINKPGSKKEEFNAIEFSDDPGKYRTAQYYIQALLRQFPNDVDKLVTRPETIDKGSWIYSNFRQFLQEINYFAYEHRFVSTAENEPKMIFTINGQQVECLSAAKNPPAMVPAIDYITETVDMATQTILKNDLFPGGTVTEMGLRQIQTFMRRLYRVFAYSYICHREIFDEYEAKHHLCERYTKFAKQYELLQPTDIYIPDSYFQKSDEA